MGKDGAQNTLLTGLIIFVPVGGLSHGILVLMRLIRPRALLAGCDIPATERRPVEPDVPPPMPVEIANKLR
ncbi:MAG: hypothetical protein OEV07_08920 [Gammaproteobacteria bacterium]|nr:hypothetical protein [Gammaproteobacteria bacterium]